MELADHVDKAAYAVRVMRLARWMSMNLTDDYERRVVGRMVLVFAPIYVDGAFTLLKKKPGLAEQDRKQLRDGIRRLRSDFEDFYDRIRHDLAAHRDAVALDVAIEAWNEIDSDTLARPAVDADLPADQRDRPRPDWVAPPAEDHVHHR